MRQVRRIEEALLGQKHHCPTPLSVLSPYGLMGMARFRFRMATQRRLPAPWLHRVRCLVECGKYLGVYLLRRTRWLWPA